MWAYIGPNFILAEFVEEPECYVLQCSLGTYGASAFTSESVHERVDLAANGFRPVRTSMPTILARRFATESNRSLEAGRTTLLQPSPADRAQLGGCAFSLSAS